MHLTGIAGKVALVTGAAQGIGDAVARTLASHGAQLALVDSQGEKVEALARELTAGGHRAVGYQADVSDSQAVDTVVNRAEYELQAIDILVSVAGVLRTGPVVKLTDQDWAKVFAVNTHGVFYVSRAVARRMMRRRSGTIVTVGSNAAGVPRMNMSAYAASKAATLLFTKCLGLELAEHGIRCNVVCPGSTDTDMQRSMWRSGGGPEDVINGSPESYKTGIPLKRLAVPSDVADAVVFLVSDQARHITMHDLYVDGGAALKV